MHATDERAAIVAFLLREADRLQTQGHEWARRPGNMASGHPATLYRQADFLRGYAARIEAGDHLELISKGGA